MYNVSEDMLPLYNLLMVGIVPILLLGLPLVIFYLIVNWKVYKKGGKPGWASLVPIYNNIVLIEIAGLPVWYFILLFIPIANIYVIFKLNIELAHKFGKSTLFGLLLVFIPGIFYPILAFSKKAVYKNSDIATQENTVYQPQIGSVKPTVYQESNENNIPFTTQQVVVNEPTNPIPTEINNNVSNFVPPVQEPVMNNSAEPPVQTEAPVENNIPFTTQQVVVNEPTNPMPTEINNNVSNFAPPVQEPVMNNSFETPVQTEAPVENNIPFTAPQGVTNEPMGQTQNYNNNQNGGSI